MGLPRLDFDSARRRVMNRGVRREPIFLDDESRALFLSILNEFAERFGVRVRGFALMPNH
jgi:REP element-mobilizing transposase RayT